MPPTPSDQPDRKPIDLRKISETMYKALRDQAGKVMHGERAGHSLTPTAVLHEFIASALSGQKQFVDRSHLLAAAAMAMRNFLVDHARTRGRIKRGGGRKRINWDDVVNSVATHDDPGLLLDLDQAIENLGTENERYGQIAVFRLFGAMTNEEVATVVGVSLSTVEKDWRYVKTRMGALLSEPAVLGK